MRYRSPPLRHRAKESTDARLERRRSKGVGVNCVASERRERNSASGGQRPPASVKLFMSLPEEALVAGELELIQTHLAGLFDRVFAPAVDSETAHGDDQPWP